MKGLPALALVTATPSYLERAMGGQAGDAVAEERCRRVAAEMAPQGVVYRRHQVGVGGEADVLLAFEAVTVCGHAGRLVDQGDGHGDHLVGQQATGAVIDGDEEGVVGGCQHLVAVVGVAELGDLADGEGRADRQFVAAELGYPWPGSPATLMMTWFWVLSTSERPRLIWVKPVGPTLLAALKLVVPPSGTDRGVPPANQVYRWSA